MLAPDAEVLALEALAQLGKTEELRQRANELLRRHPGDGHSPRIRQLIDAVKSEGKE